MSITRIAVVFPGQGSQTVGMGRSLHHDFAAAREVFEEASAAVGFDLARVCFEDPDHQLEITSYTQPCVLTASLAAWRVLRAETGIEPVCVAGHSLGEYTALAAAGALAPADAVRAVRERGLAMAAAVPDGQGTMAAIMGASREAITAACIQASNGDIVVPANDNAPAQVVISGHAGAVDRASEILKQQGARVRKLKVSGPFHTWLMKPAADRMAEVLPGLAYSRPAFPVIANVDVQTYDDPATVSDRLLRQLTEPVRWRETVQELDRREIQCYIECGPGTILAGLIKKTLAAPLVLAMNEPTHLGVIREALS